MNRNYSIRLDLHFSCNNSNMNFMQFDNNTSDFSIKVTRSKDKIDFANTIAILYAVKPSGKVEAQFIELSQDILYANLEPHMRDEIGSYQARLLLVEGNERVTTDTVAYTINEDKIISAYQSSVESTNEFKLLIDMLNRLSTIETNEANRESNFKLIQEEWTILKAEFNNYVNVKVVERVDEVIKPIVDTKVTDLTKQVIIDLNNRVDVADTKISEVDSKIVEVNKFVEVKESQITNTINQANTDVDNAIAKIPPKSELVGAKGSKGDKGDKGDKGSQGSKGDKGDKGSTGSQGVKGETGATPSITHLETSISNKINEVEARFNKLGTDKQQEAEVLNARTDALGTTHASLKDAMNSNFNILNKMQNVIFEDVEG